MRRLPCDDYQILTDQFWISNQGYSEWGLDHQKIFKAVGGNSTILSWQFDKKQDWIFNDYKQKTLFQILFQVA